MFNFFQFIFHSFRLKFICFDDENEEYENLNEMNYIYQKNKIYNQIEYIYINFHYRIN